MVTYTHSFKTGVLFQAQKRQYSDLLYLRCLIFHKYTLLAHDNWLLLYSICCSGVLMKTFTTQSLFCCCQRSICCKMSPKSVKFFQKLYTSLFFHVSNFFRYSLFSSIHIFFIIIFHAVGRTPHSVFLVSPLSKQNGFLSR